MADDLPPVPGEGSTIRQPISGHSTPPHSSQSTRSRMWPAIALAVIAAIVSVAAVFAAFTRSSSSAPTAATTVPTYTAAETAAAQRQLCDTYKLAAQAVRVDTAGTDKGLARIATTNGALMLDTAAANPALDTNHRDAARALATAYTTLTAKGSSGVATDAEYQATLNDIVAKDSEMKNVCGSA